MKYHRFLVLILVTGMLLAACGGQNGEEPTATREAGAASTATSEPSMATAATQEGKYEIVFAGDLPDDSAGQRIYCINRDGTGLHPLTSASDETIQGEVFEAFPAWSPDGSHVAYSRTGSDGGVFIVNADGSEDHRILDGWARDIDWSPEGSRLVMPWFEQGWPARPENVQLIVVELDGTNLRVISDDSELRNGSATDISPKWSPDGSRILFEHWDYGEQALEDMVALYVVSPDGSNLQPVDTSDIVAYYSSGWSPDGEDVTVGGGIPDDPEDAPGGFSVPLDGGDPDRLTPEDLPMLPASFDWSPDGSQALYITLPPGEAVGPTAPDAYDLAMINADGTNPVTLVQGFGSFGPLELEPKWRPPAR